MGPSIPAATRPTLEEAKEAGNTQSPVTPFSFTMGEIQGETHTLRTGGGGTGRKQQQRADRTKALPWSALHDRQLLRENTLLSVCAALLTGLRDQTQSGTTSPTLGFFDTLFHYI